MITEEINSTISLIFSGIATIISLIALYQNHLATKTNKREQENSNRIREKLNRIEADKLLEEALDLMNFNRPGTHSMFKKHHQPLTKDEAMFYELACRKINKALAISPNYYLGSHYHAIYKRRIKGLKYAIGHYEKAVELLKQDGSPEANEDGWPYHDLATVYEKLGRASDAEEMYSKAIKIDRTEPGFYEDLSMFYYNQGKFEKYKEFYSMAERFAKKRGQKLNQPDYRNDR